MTALISSLHWTKNSKIEPTDVLHIYDVFDENQLNFYIQAGRPKYIVSDHWVSIDIPGYIVYCLPLWVADQVRLFKDAQFNDPTTRYAFNFMINKKQVNRHLCLKLVELFELTDYDYTWSGITPEFDMSDIINELNSLEDASPINSNQRSFMLAPVNIKPNFIEFPGSANPTDPARVNGSNYGGNQWTWNNVLSDLFLNSAISLITESVKFEKGAVFTEKTIYAVLGLTLPIWVGGYQQAHHWQRFGFDIFDDIIDHSYQNYDTLFERCYYAFGNNLHLLSNRSHAEEIRRTLLPRLQHNRELLLNGQLARVCQQEISTWPQDLQQQTLGILKYFTGVNVDLTFNKKFVEQAK